MKGLQKFTPEYIEQCRRLTPDAKLRCRLEGERYQTKIKTLMLAWIEGDAR